MLTTMNPLLPLIANLSTKNRDYVVFVGAGFSKDAGIPSGWDILIDSLKPLYIEDTKIESPAEIKYEELEKWYLNHPEYSKLGYSQLLELIYKGEIERRQHLKKYFENKEIGQSHKLLAQLVKGGLIRFIFTTNFDDLIEKALEEYNVNYDVISSDDILSGSISWDRVKECRIYKLHGDYKAGKVKNTISELSSIDSRIADDFKYIIDRHGMIIIGYAGRDEGIMKYILDRNFNSYPIYWQLVNYPPETDEYKFFNKLKLKSASDPNKINFIENPSASKFLQEVINGIENLDRLIIVEQKNRNNYESYVLNQNDKKIRALTLDTIKEFKNLYDDHNSIALTQREYFAKYKTFDELNKKITFIYDYIDTLLTYKELPEASFFIKELLKTTSSYQWPNTDDFIEPTMTYLLVNTFGAILLKHNCIDIIREFYSMIRKSELGYVNLLDRLTQYSNGWTVIIQSSEFKGYWAPKFQIICAKHVPSQVTVKEFLKFDAFITMDLAINSVKIKWFCFSRTDTPIFEEVYYNYIEKYLTSKEDCDNLISRLQTQPKEVPFYPDGIEEVITIIETVTKKRFELKLSFIKPKT